MPQLEKTSTDMARRHVLKLAGTTTAKFAAFSAMAAGVLPGSASAMGSRRSLGGGGKGKGRGKGGSSGGSGGGVNDGGSANCFLKGTRIRTEFGRGLDRGSAHR